MSKILIVDDQVNKSRILKLILESKNFVVKAISECGLLESSIITFKPDLILLQIFLKGGNSCELWKQLKTEKATAHIPVLLFSGNNNIQAILN